MIYSLLSHPTALFLNAEVIYTHTLYSWASEASKRCALMA